MGCVPSRPNVNKAQHPSPPTPVKSDAQLEYELNNCYEHYSSISGELARNQKIITEILGRELQANEYSVILSKLEKSSRSNSEEESKAIRSLKALFSTAQQGSKLLPLLLKKSEKIQATLLAKKGEIDDFRTQVQQLLDFCQSIVIHQ